MLLRLWLVRGCVMGWLLGLLVAAQGTVAGMELALTALAVACVVAGGAALLVGRIHVFGAGGVSNWQRVVLLLWAIACGCLGMLRVGLEQPEHDAANISHVALATPIDVQGSVTSEPDERGKGEIVTIAVTRFRAAQSASWQAADGTIQIFAIGAPSAFTAIYGDVVQFNGQRQTARGQLPAGINADFGAVRVRILARDGGNPVLGALLRLREALASALMHSLPAPEASLIIGIVLGLKTPELRSRLALFTRTGTIHLVVTSGLKVTLIGSIVAGLVKSFPRWLGFTLSLSSILLYVILSGAGPAALRAGIMGGILVTARWLGRDYDVYNALALAALFMTIASPFVIFDAGFGLSTIGTLGIAILAPRWRGPFEHWLRRVPGHGAIAEVLATGLAAQVATLPLVAITFHTVSLIAPLANLLLVPFLPFFLVGGALVGGVGLLSAGAGAIAGAILWPVLWLADGVINVTAALPWAAVTVGALPGAITLLWTLLLCLIPLVWRLQMLTPHHAVGPRLPLFARASAVVATLLITCLVAVGVSVATPAPVLAITALDVGAGGPATLVRLRDGRTILIDGGADGVALTDALAGQLPFWQRDLSLVIVTNVRPGHFAGLRTALGAYHIDAVADPGALHPEKEYTAWFTDLEAAHVPLTRLARGDGLDLGAGVAITVASPSPPLIDGTAQQDTNGLVLWLTAPGFRMLFAGDADALSLAQSLPSAANGPVDVVQFCQTANEGILSQTVAAEWLRQLHPRLALIAPSARRPPKAGTLAAAPTPDDATLTAHTTIIRTWQTGTVTLVSDGDGWRLSAGW